MATLTAPSGRRKSTAIDMTPMVDLAFLLLTFFVLTTTLSDPWVIKLNMPEKVKDPVDQPIINPKRVLTLVLGDQNKVYWYLGVATGIAETTDFSSNGIRKILMSKKRIIKNLYVLIKPSDQSQYQNVIDALDEMIIAEIQQYSVVDMETLDKKLVAM